MQFRHFAFGAKPSLFEPPCFLRPRSARRGLEEGSGARTKPFSCRHDALARKRRKGGSDVGDGAEPKTKDAEKTAQKNQYSSKKGQGQRTDEQNFAIVSFEVLMSDLLNGPLYKLRDCQCGADLRVKRGTRRPRRRRL